MSLADKLNGRLADIDAQIQAIKDRAQAEIAVLNKRKLALQRALAQATAENEAILSSLEDMGVIEIK